MNPITASKSPGRIHMDVIAILSYPDIIPNPVVPFITKLSNMTAVAAKYLNTIIVKPLRIVLYFRSSGWEGWRWSSCCWRGCRRAARRRIARRRTSRRHCLIHHAHPAHSHSVIFFAFAFASHAQRSESSSAVTSLLPSQNRRARIHERRDKDQLQQKRLHVAIIRCLCVCL